MRLIRSASQFLRNGYPFLFVLGAEVIFILYLILSHRGVIGHDAFQYFGLQYYFLDNAVNTGETAQWMPFMTHGTVSNWWYAIQSSMGQGGLLALGPLVRVLAGWNFLPIYYLGILFDTTLLILGGWLLGRRYFKSDLTVLFVCVTAAGSATWFTQPWYNLHLYFALPLIFFFIHELFEKGQWRYFLLAGNLFAIQCCGNLPYYAPLTSLVIFLYALFYVLYFRETATIQLARLLRNWRRGVVPVVLVAASLCAVAAVLTSGTELIANYNAGRLPDGSVTLDTFLNYGTNSNLRWFELLSRVSASLDYSVYFGYLALLFAALALALNRTKAVFLVASTAVVVLLIANSTPFAALFYYVWPTMRYFRHVSLASTIVRLLLCFLAGFGFEQVLLAPAKDYRIKLGIAILAFGGLALILFMLSVSYETARSWIEATVVGTLHNDRTVFEKSYLVPELSRSALWCLGAALFSVAVALGRRSGRSLAIGAIAFQAMDIYAFKFDLSQLRTVPLNAEQYEVNRLQAMPYTARRVPIDYETHPRGKNVPQNHYPSGARYWTADSYMFTDPPANSGRADHWLWPFDDFLRAYAGEPLRDTGVIPRAFRPYKSFVLPLENPGASIKGGVTDDKIQFFSRAHAISSDSEIAKLLASDSVSSNVLLISGSPGEDESSLKGDERLSLAYDVVQYDSNNITIRVVGAEAGTWLYYADVWHPSWHVTVNDAEVPLSKANLAYKAVPLVAGENLVHFRFQSLSLWLSMTFLNWNALLWVVLVPCLAVRVLRSEGREGQSRK